MRPLPPDTFPPLVVAEDDAIELQKLADLFVTEGLNEYREFRERDGGQLDPQRWKVIKKRDGITSYLDQTVGGDMATAVRSDTRRLTVGGMTFSPKLHGILAHGAVPGSFNDMAFGLLHPTTEMLKIKSAYTQDKIADAKVLATIVSPSPDDPVRGLSLKWSVSDFAPVLLKRVVRPRDFVYLEAIGIHVTPEGERIGYNLLHSIQIPGIRELPDFNIVRGNFSICALFRQQSSGEIELYMKGFVDSMGDIHTSVAIPASAEALMSYRKAVYCGQMKKLNWVLSSKKTIMVDLHTDSCSVCGHIAKSSALRAPKYCRVCMNKVCSGSCSGARKLAFLSTANHRVFQKTMTFCNHCLGIASRADALEIATEESVRQNPFDAYELASTSGSSSSSPASPTNSELPDAQREFFG